MGDCVVASISFRVKSISFSLKSTISTMRFEHTRSDKEVLLSFCSGSTRPRWQTRTRRACA